VQQDRTRNGDFRWGIWGTGVIAASFAHDVAASGDMRVEAVCSRSAESAEAFCRRIGAARAHADAQAFLSDPAIDAVYIATPSALHVPQTLQAIAAGKPCLTEKPLALDARGAAAIETTAKEQTVFVMEAMWTRFLPAIQSARRHIAAGRIGKVTHIEADLSYFRAYDPQSRFFDPALGGGAAFDLGVYPVSLALFFMGLPDETGGHSVRAPSGVDMRTEIDLAWKDGATARLSCGFDRDGENLMLIEGTQGGLLIHAPFLKAERLTLLSAGAMRSSLFGPRAGGLAGKAMKRLSLPGRKAENHALAGNGLQFEACAVRDAVRAGEISSPVMPLSHSIAVAEILQRALSGTDKR